MGLRETIRANPIIGIGIFAVAIGIVVWTQFRGTEPAPGENIATTFFYDLKMGDIVYLPTGTNPPATTKSGNPAVKAHVFSCGECNADEWFYYLETLNDQAKAALDSVGENDDPTRALQADAMGRMVAEVPTDGGDPQWVLANSAHGQGMAAAYNSSEKCNGGGSPKICRP